MVFEDPTGTIVRKICMACSKEFTGLEASCPHDGNLLIPLPQDPFLNKKLAGRYSILSVIGTGGMGVVYKAKPEVMDRYVAIKMLRLQFVSDSQSIKRFQQEARAASRLDHPNVVTLYDYGVTETGQPYLVMDFIEGISLAQLIKEQDHISVERSIHIFTQACNAIDHAHKKGVIHRDLKPGNIMLLNTEEDKDFVKVVDFGVAKLVPINSEDVQIMTQTGEVCGSPVYMSPEQCLGQNLDIRADIYSMGVVIYHTLTGKIPLMGRSMVETMSKQINETAPRFSEVRPDLLIPGKLEKVVFKALNKEPHLRQQSMLELAYDLELALDPNHVVYTADAVFDVQPQSATKNKLGYLFIAAIIIVAIATTIFQNLNHQSISITGNATKAPAVPGVPAAPATPAAPVQITSPAPIAANSIQTQIARIKPKVKRKVNKIASPMTPSFDPFTDLKHDRSY